MPNLRDYEQARASFSWEAVRREMDGLPGGRGVNIAHEAVDRHARGPGAHRVAIRWIGREGAIREYTYSELRRLTNQFANALRSLGVGPGDSVFAVSGRLPELYVAALGTLKNRSVFCSLFSAYGPDPVRVRLEKGGCKVLVTTDRLYRRRLERVRDTLPSIRHVVIVRQEEGPAIPGTLDFGQLIASASEEYVIPDTDPEDPALLHFTSGTTGAPKGVTHVHEAVLAHYATAKLVLDLRRDDVYWCTADPGWVTGVSYGMVAPLTTGATALVDEEEFQPERWYRLLQDQGVSVWYTAPTAIRMLMRAGPDLPRGFDLSGLRLVASVGEPLGAEAVLWGRDALGSPIHDTWWQTETGCIMIANFASMDVKPGSMGRPVPGIEAGIVQRQGKGEVHRLDQPGMTGEIALRAGWPSMFRGYHGASHQYEEAFAGPWYLSGDLARVDRDGYFWFVGRADDVIKSAGHLVGPVEVENTLLQHPAVAEVGVVGRPDPVAGEIVRAVIVLRPGSVADEALEKELLAHARRRLGSVIAPKEIVFRETLPRTTSGKIMRRVLRDEERSEAGRAEPAAAPENSG